MRHVVFAWLAVLLLWLGGCAEAPIAQPRSDRYVPRYSLPPTPMPARQSPDAARPQPLTPAPQIVGKPLGGPGVQLALILPLESAAFGKAAEAVRLGFLAGRRADSQLPMAITVYPTTESAEVISATYSRALEAGAQLVVGPLTRDAVARLAESGLVTVPTLALNLPGDARTLPPRLYLFGLSTESEARQIARLAADQGYVRATTLTSSSPLAKRIQQAFDEEWQQLGRDLAGEFTLTGEAADYPLLQEYLRDTSPDALFLAASNRPARMARPYLDLDAGTPTFSTSLIFAGNDPIQNTDLNGIVFVDMPWLLQPEDPLVAQYERRYRDVESQRLYALGIDAFRIVSWLLSHGADSTPFAGVTGTLRLNGEQIFEREALPAQFRDGTAVVLEPAGL